MTSMCKAYAISIFVAFGLLFGLRGPSACAQSTVGLGEASRVLSPAASASQSVRGITISTHGIGREWGSDRIVETLKGIQQTGANWIAIHPYARIGRDGSVNWRRYAKGEVPVHWTRPVKEAQALGLKVLVKPHLAYWGSGWSWRGEIKFETEAQWERFFKEYEAWMKLLAKACSGAEGFAVGTELDQTLDHEPEWRRVIATVRKETKACLTYAANWTDYQRVPFWDALDRVGIQAYFPIAKTENADEQTLINGWKTTMKEVVRYATKVKRDVVFTELGYTASLRAPIEPWKSNTDESKGLATQALCYRIALDAIEREPRVHGSFLWKWFPVPRTRSRDFALDIPSVKKVLRQVWR